MGGGQFGFAVFLCFDCQRIGERVVEEDADGPEFQHEMEDWFCRVGFKALFCEDDVFFFEFGFDAVRKIFVIDSCGVIYELVFRAETTRFIAWIDIVDFATERHGGAGERVIRGFDETIRILFPIQDIVAFFDMRFQHGGIEKNAAFFEFGAFLFILRLERQEIPPSGINAKP